MSILQRAVSIFVVCICSLGQLHAAPADEALSANHSLSDGSPAEALSKYQMILDSPHPAAFSSPELWYHRGLAEQKMGDQIAASLSLRRAVLLDPSFTPAVNALTSVLASLGLPTATHWQGELLTRVHPDVLILGGAMMGWLGVLLFVYLLMAGPRRPSLIAWALVACILGHGLSLLGTFADPRRLAQDEAVVTAKSPPTLRETPADSAQANGTLAPGSLITILSRNGAWWKVSDGTHTGWISSTTVTPLLPASSG
jgi:hypothetical protein